MKLQVLRNASVYSPQAIGLHDLVLAQGLIVALEPCGRIALNNLDYDSFDLDGKPLIPGFVDTLTHIIGGGGEGGFHTRTPAMQLGDAISSGVTTVTGVLGTDAITRTLTDLLAHARSLSHYGLNVVMHSGSYHLPLTTITGSVQRDLVLIPEIIGVGEVAISDHRGSHPSVEEVIRLASDCRTAGMLANKAGLVSIHVGDHSSGLQTLWSVITQSAIPASQFLPTHINRTSSLLDDGIAWAKSGGLIDFTASTTPEILAGGEIDCVSAVKRALSSGVSPTQITLSTDGHASLPVFDQAGHLNGLKVGEMSSLLQQLQAALHQGFELETFLPFITENPARILKQNCGQIAVGRRADLVCLSDDKAGHIESVWLEGQLALHQREILLFSEFE